MTGLDRAESLRLVGVVGVSTLVLTASFVGLLSVVAGGNEGMSGRLPLYVLVMAVAFVGTIVLAEQRRRTSNARTVITGAGSLAGLVFVVVTLSGEGVVYAARNPSQVVASELSLYFLAAGLIATGLGYWGLRHWGEFDRPGLAASGRL
jgi:FtsH-binding integral membrane protein